MKNLTTAEGGSLTWTIDDNSLYEKLSLISLHGQNKDALSKMKLSNWEYDIICTGYKNNMIDILASIGIAQLKRFESLVKKRRKLALLYNSFLKNSNIQIYQENSVLDDSAVHLYITRFVGKNESFRNDLIRKIASKGIVTNVHYKPLPMMTAYKNLGFNILDYPNSFKMYENEITLPLHTLMSEEDVEYVCNCLSDMRLL